MTQQLAGRPRKRASATCRNKSSGHHSCYVSFSCARTCPLLEQPLCSTQIKGRGKEILVPYVKEMISGVDLEKRVLTLELPDGLLDL